MAEILEGFLGFYRPDSLFTKLTAHEQKSVFTDCFRLFFKVNSHLKPIIIFLDDLQWFDEDSRDLLAGLNTTLKTCQIMLIVTARENETFEYIRDTFSDAAIPLRTLQLGAFEGSTQEHLIESHLNAPGSQQLMKTISEKTGGNPFYTEQFCHYILERDIVEKSPTGLILKSKAEAIIPAGITPLLIARIDSLTEELRELIKVAAVVGPEFEKNVLAEVMVLLHNYEQESPFSSDQMSILLEHGEREKIWFPTSTLRYLFRHIMLRDAAYEMQLKTQLRKIHEITANILNTTNSENPEILTQCARHLNQAEKIYESINLFTLAGVLFRKKNEFWSARDSFKNALNLTKKMWDEAPDSTKLDVLCNYSGICKELALYDEALEYYYEYESMLSFKIPAQIHRLFDCKNLISDIYFQQGKFNESKKLCKELREIIGRSFDLKSSAEIIGIAVNNINQIGLNYWIMGDFDSAVQHANEALELLYAAHMERDHLMFDILTHLGLFHQYRGDFKTSLMYQQKAMECIAFQNQGNSLAEAHVQNNLAGAYFSNNRLDEAKQSIEKAYKTRKEILGELHPLTNKTLNNRGIISFRQERFADSFAIYELVHENLKTTLGDNHPDTIIALSNKASILSCLDEPDLALKVIDEVFRLRENKKMSEHPNTASSHSIRGTILVRLNKYPEAYLDFFKAGKILEKIQGGDNDDYFNTQINRIIVLLYQEEYLQSFRVINHCEKAIFRSVQFQKASVKIKELKILTLSYLERFDNVIDETLQYIQLKKAGGKKENGLFMCCALMKVMMFPDRLTSENKKRLIQINAVTNSCTVDDYGRKLLSLSSRMNHSHLLHDHLVLYRDWLEKEGNKRLLHIVEMLINDLNSLYM